MKRHTWQMPWSFREGFIIIAGLVTVGTIWQAFLPLFSFEVPAWPGNIILGFVITSYSIHYTKLYEVELGNLLNDGLVEVKKGIAGNELVVTAGVNSLVENQQVKILGL